MKERPIIMSGESVRAILDGRKTMTRRVVKWPIKSRSDGAKVRLFVESDVALVNELLTLKERHPNRRVRCPFGAPGDRLWVREGWADITDLLEWDGGGQIPDGCHCYAYRADGQVRQCTVSLRGPEDWDVGDLEPGDVKWRPSIHMPRQASRLTLEVTNVRVERLQEISAADAAAEGVQIPVTPDGHPVLCITERVDSHQLWKSPKTATLDDYWTGYFALAWNAVNAKRGYGWDTDPHVWVVEFKRVHAGECRDAAGESGE